MVRQVRDGLGVPFERKKLDRPRLPRIPDPGDDFGTDSILAEQRKPRRGTAC